MIVLEEPDKWHSLLGIKKRRFEKCLCPVGEKEQRVFLGPGCWQGLPCTWHSRGAQVWQCSLTFPSSLALPRGWETSALVLELLADNSLSFVIFLFWLLSRISFPQKAKYKEKNTWIRKYHLFLCGLLIIYLICHLCFYFSVLQTLPEAHRDRSGESCLFWLN